MFVLIKQHGRTILYVLIAVSVLGIAFGIRVNGYTGFIRAAYGKAMEDTGFSGVRPSQDAAAARDAAVRSRPKITFCCAKILPQKAVDLNAMLTAQDADGNPVKTEITDIAEESGKSILYRTEEDRKNKVTACDTASFWFPSAGIYIMDVKAVDQERKTAEVRFRIPVSGN